MLAGGGDPDVSRCVAAGAGGRACSWWTGAEVEGAIEHLHGEHSRGDVAHAGLNTEDRTASVDRDLDIKSIRVAGKAVLEDSAERCQADAPEQPRDGHRAALPRDNRMGPRLAADLYREHDLCMGRGARRDLEASIEGDSARLLRALKAATASGVATAAAWWQGEGEDRTAVPLSASRRQQRCQEKQQRREGHSLRARQSSYLFSQRPFEASIELHLS